MIVVIDEPDLTSWLRARAPQELATILAHRPDASWGAPLRGLDDLGLRLQRPASVARAIDQLPLPGLQLVHALVALGPRPTETAVFSLLTRGNRSESAHLAAVRSLVDVLAAHGLAWPLGAGGIAVNPGVRAVIDEPLGIGRTVAGHLEHTASDQLQSMVRALGLPAGMRRADMADALADFLTDPARVRALLATAPEAAVRRLRALSTDRESTGHYHPGDQQDREGENWARRRGLLFGGQYYAPDVPVEIVLAVLDTDLTVNFNPDPPVVETAPVAPDSVLTAAAAAAGEFTATVAALLDAMSRTPIPALKSGGVGTRELTRIAKLLDVEESVVRLALELIRDVGLLGGTGSGVGTGESAAAWRAVDPSVRYADLVVAWWGLPVTPTINRTEDGKPLPVLGGRVADGSSMLLRWKALAVLAELPVGSAVSQVETLVEQMIWRAPGSVDRDDPSIIALWAEAGMLGVLAQGAVSPVGTALLGRDPRALESVAAQLLAPAATVGSFGSDLTVMVAGSPSAAVSALLDSCADRESRGAAVVWRFSPASVRRAMDEGAAADDLLRGLRSIAESELPQPLTYLIGDVQRRHGNLVVVPALSCVRSDDEALLLEVAAHRSLRSLRPLLLAPTVITFQSDGPAVLAALRAAGYLPVPADEYGVVDLRRGPAGTSSAAATSAPGHGRVLDRLRELGSAVGDPADSTGDPALLELADALLSLIADADFGDAADGPGAGGAAADPMATAQLVELFGSQLDPLERRQLIYAIDHQVPVEITYRSASGGITSRIISDIELDLNQLRAWCHLRNDERVFAIDRVLAVTPARA